MKTKCESGIALIATLLVMVLLSALLVGFIVSINSDQSLIGNDRDQNRAFYASLAGLEQLTADLGTLFNTTYAPSVAQINALTAEVPSIPYVSYVSPGGTSGYSIEFPLDGMGRPRADTRTIPTGPYEGLVGLITPYTMTSTAHTLTGSEVRMRRTLQTVAVPVFQFGVFSETDLSFHAGPNFKNGDTWARIAELAPSIATTACFGHSVSVSDNYVIVGSWNNDPGQGYGTGAAYVFGRTGLTYSQVAKIVASDRQYGDNFGESVAITEDYAVVGAYKDDDRGTDSGSAYVFRRIGSSWVQSAKLLASNGANSDFFGKSVSIDGSTVVVGAFNKRTDTGGGVGAAYWFELGSSWQEQEYLRPGSPVIGTGYAEYVGWSVSVDGPNAIVGGMFDCQGPSCSGAAYIFAVPEPATLFVMMAAGLPALLKRRRRVRSYRKRGLTLELKSRASLGTGRACPELAEAGRPGDAAPPAAKVRAGQYSLLNREEQAALLAVVDGWARMIPLRICSPQGSSGPALALCKSRAAREAKE